MFKITLYWNLNYAGNFNLVHYWGHCSHNTSQEFSSVPTEVTTDQVLKTEKRELIPKWNLLNFSISILREKQVNFIAPVVQD